MQKTIKASIIGLTNIKKELLDNDYFNYQWWMIFGVDKGLLSAFKAAKGHKQKIVNYLEYPLPLQTRFIKNWFRTRDTKLTKNWIKIPNSRRKGQGIWLPLKFHQPLPEKYELKDSYLVRKNNKYYIHFVIEIEEPKVYQPKNILGLDLGLRNPIVMVDLKTRKTFFLGKEIKEIRGKYYYLRKKLGKNNYIKQIKKIRNKEKNKINSRLHKISKDIINLAYNTKSAVVVGELKYLNKNKGRKFNRKLNNFSYYKFNKYIEYKAKEKGVPVIFVNEAYTSKTCTVCGSIGSRKGNWFSCNNCRYEDNADRNAAFNISKRGLSYMLKSGVEASALKSLISNNEETSTIKMQNCIFA
ncbi:MAG TPA: transposase [Candidatus Nanoarchaeia archaeon]|nr:transposase [Candidatus Nanoarchaeia archaeon]